MNRQTKLLLYQAVIFYLVSGIFQRITPFGTYGSIISTMLLAGLFTALEGKYVKWPCQRKVDKSENRQFLVYGKVLHTVSNKNIHLPVFEICVFRGYLRNHLSSKKVFYIYLHPCLKSFQMKKKFLRSGHKIS